MSYSSRFSFVGEFLKPREQEKFVKEWLGGQDGKSEMARIMFGVKENSHNAGYVQLFGMTNKVILTTDTDKKDLKVNWADRFDDNIVKNVASYRKHYVDLGEDFGGMKEFITAYDFIQYLKENLPKYNGKIMVKGNWKKDIYNGSIRDNFEIRNVYAIEKDAANKLELECDLFYNASSIDMSELENEGKIYVNGYVEQYINKDVKNQYVPQVAVLCNKAYNFTDERHAKMWEVKKGYLQGLPKKRMQHIPWKCRLINGAEELEFTEDMLTPQQKMMIEVGLNTLDDFKPKNNTYGAKINEIRLTIPILTGNYSDGAIECDETMAEFEEKIYQGNKEETLADVLTVKDDDDFDEESLF